MVFDFIYMAPLLTRILRNDKKKITPAIMISSESNSTGSSRFAFRRHRSKPLRFPKVNGLFP
jgi:hypothetical protein